MKIFGLSIYLILLINFILVIYTSCQETATETTNKDSTDSNTEIVVESNDTTNENTENTENIENNAEVMNQMTEDNNLTNNVVTTETKTDESKYNDKNMPLHCNEQKEEGFKIGEYVDLCVHMLPRQQRIAFNVSVDNYEVLSITGGYIFAEKDTLSKQSFMFQFANITTEYPSTYLNKKTKRVSTLFNVVIKLDKGKIADVIWDNECWDCFYEDSCVLTENIMSFKNVSELFDESVRFLYFNFYNFFIQKNIYFDYIFKKIL
jgi:hypothetical protein